MMRIREPLRPWWMVGLAGAAANFVLLAPGMGIALGALPVGLVLGLWIGRKARRSLLDPADLRPGADRLRAGRADGLVLDPVSCWNT